MKCSVLYERDGFTVEYMCMKLIIPQHVQLEGIWKKTGKYESLYKNDEISCYSLNGYCINLTIIL
jgi:hypothetical protein